jgi:DNA-binding MarR family transcriptional regulator
VDRGVVERTRGVADRRQVLLTLSPAGAAVLRELSLEHRAELRAAGPALVRALHALLADEAGQPPPAAGHAAAPSSPTGGGECAGD